MPTCRADRLLFIIAYDLPTTSRDRRRGTISRGFLSTLYSFARTVRGTRVHPQWKSRVAFAFGIRRFTGSAGLSEIRFGRVRGKQQCYTYTECLFVNNRTACVFRRRHDAVVVIGLFVFFCYSRGFAIQNIIYNSNNNNTWFNVTATVWYSQT